MGMFALLGQLEREELANSVKYKAPESKAQHEDGLRPYARGRRSLVVGR